MSASTLAIVQKSSALAAVDLGGDRSVRPLLPQGRWPAWRPGSLEMAASVIGLSQPLRSSIHLVHAETAAATELYGSPGGVVPVIAPRVPHYVMWSPGGEQLALVANGEFGLQLETLVPGEPKAHQVLEVGAPIFSSWSREGTTLAAHIGTALTLFRFMSDGVSRVHIEEKASGFRTPAFTADGRQVLYAVPREPGVALMRYGVESGDRDEVASFAGGVALSSLPDGNVAVAVTRQPDSGVFDGLWVLDPEANHDRHLLVRGPFASAAWAPDGDRVALLIPSQLGDGRYSIQVRDRSGHLAAASEPFLPSQDLRMLFGFWDQYALSHHLWSPDGSQLAITGRLPTDGVSSSFSDPAGSYVLLWNPQRHQPLEPLTPGELAFFPPA